MNTDTAKTILHNAGTLMELTATFEARYHKTYVMRPGSPEDAWKLHEAIQNTQIAIGRLLTLTALETPIMAHGVWWERQDVMDTSIAGAIIAQAGRLIACSAYHVEEDTDWSYASLNIQRSIAGLLAHTARMVAMDDIEHQAVAS